MHGSLRKENDAYHVLVYTNVFNTLVVHLSNVVLAEIIVLQTASFLAFYLDVWHTLGTIARLAYTCGRQHMFLSACTVSANNCIQFGLGWAHSLSKLIVNTSYYLVSNISGWQLHAQTACKCVQKCFRLLVQSRSRKRSNTRWWSATLTL